MLAPTHRRWAALTWVGGCTALDVLAVRAGAPLPVHPTVVAVGVLPAVLFSAGKLSPDVDRIWAPGRPERNYHWSGHRGWTHRWWFAAVLWLATWIGVTAAGLPVMLAAVAYAPVVGWSSHLTGDMVFGRLRILGKRVGIGWTTGTEWERAFALMTTGLAIGAGAVLLVLLTWM